jgi:hypothetical protein
MRNLPFDQRTALALVQVQEPMNSSTISASDMEDR